MSSFYWKKDLNLIKREIISGEEIQILITMIMLTRSSERVFNQSRYTGISATFVCQNEFIY